MKKKKSHGAPKTGTVDVKSTYFTVKVLAMAKKEGREFLRPAQYLHVTDIIKRLAYFNRPEEMSDMRIEKVVDFYELKEKGGPLGKINLRIFFGVFADTREIVVVKVYKKEQEHRTPRHIVLNVQSRLRKYRNGELREEMTVFNLGKDARG
jgi:hypothetical protein